MITEIIKEPKRHCGMRKISGLYMVSDPQDHLNCISLPYNVTTCPCCNEGIKFSRGYKWFVPNKLFQNISETCSGFIESTCSQKHDCPLKSSQKSGLMWVGSQFYTPENFIEEAIEFGVSKRIASVPNNFVLGKTWVFLAHNKGGISDSNKKVPAIFYVFKPRRIEKITSITQYKDHIEMNKFKMKGITPIPVSDSDFDHRGTAYDRIHGKSLFE